MNTSIMLARIIGPSLAIVAIALFINKERSEKITLEISQSPAILYTVSFYSLAMSLFLVNIHNVWVLDWRMVITALLWMILLKSVLWLLVPDIAQRLMAKTKKGSIQLLLCFLIGLFLCYKGYQINF